MLRNVDLKIKSSWPCRGHHMMSALFWFAGLNHHSLSQEDQQKLTPGKALCAAGCLGLLTWNTWWMTLTDILPSQASHSLSWSLISPGLSTNPWPSPSAFISDLWLIYRPYTPKSQMSGCSHVQGLCGSSLGQGSTSLWSLWHTRSCQKPRVWAPVVFWATISQMILLRVRPPPVHDSSS